MDLQPIHHHIYEIRGVRVMLDRDLAEMYGIETKVLKQAVKRNLERFPSDFMFVLTEQEFANLRSQIVTSSWGGARYQPFAFTEHGVAMLSSVLRSPIAIQINISIIRAFVAIRQLVLNPSVDRLDKLQNDMLQLKHYMEEVFTDYNDINEDTRAQLDAINLSLAELQSRHREADKPRPPIGYQAILNQ